MMRISITTRIVDILLGSSIGFNIAISFLLVGLHKWHILLIPILIIIGTSIFAAARLSVKPN